MKNKIIIIVLTLLVIIAIGDLVHNLRRSKSDIKDNNAAANNKRFDTSTFRDRTPPPAREKIPQADNTDPNIEFKKMMLKMSGMLGIPVDEMAAMEWDTWQPRLSLTDKEALYKALKDVPIKGQAGGIGPQEIDSLRHLTAVILKHIYSGNDMEYYDYLKNSGEIVDPLYLNERKKVVEEYYKIPISSLPEDGWDFFRYMIEEIRPAFPDLETKPPQTQLVLKGNGIDLYEVNSPKFISPGINMSSLMKGTMGFFHLANPPISKEEMINKYGKVALAEFNLFLEHSPEKNNVVRPYKIRLWYDQDYQVWRPMTLNIYPGRKEILFIIRPF